MIKYILNKLFRKNNIFDHDFYNSIIKNKNKINYLTTIKFYDLFEYNNIIFFIKNDKIFYLLKYKDKYNIKNNDINNFIEMSFFLKDKILFNYCMNISKNIKQNRIKKLLEKL